MYQILENIDSIIIRYKSEYINKQSKKCLRLVQVATYSVGTFLENLHEKNSFTQVSKI